MHLLVILLSVFNMKTAHLLYFKSTPKTSHKMTFYLCNNFSYLPRVLFFMAYMLYLNINTRSLEITEQENNMRYFFGEYTYILHASKLYIIPYLTSLFFFQLFIEEFMPLIKSIPLEPPNYVTTATPTFSGKPLPFVNNSDYYVISHFFEIFN